MDSWDASIRMHTAKLIVSGQKMQSVLKFLFSGRNKERVEAFAENWGYEERMQDWREPIERADIDAIDIAAPNHMHKEMPLPPLRRAR